MYFPVATSSDDRSARGITPIKLVNVYLERQPDNADPRKQFALVPTPGKTKRLTLAGGHCRGIFSASGVQGDALFAVGGTKLYSITSAWAATDQGTISGARAVVMQGFDANLLILGDSHIYQFGESTTWVTLGGDLWTDLAGESWSFLSSGTPALVTINDVDIPDSPYTLAVLAERALTSGQGTDVFDWSSVGNPEAWPASGFASSQNKPDPIVNQIVVGQYLYSLGSETTQIWRAVGGVDSEAFDTLGSEPVERGLIARDAAIRIDQTLFSIGDDRTAYLWQNFFPAPIVNRDLELALQIQSDGTDPTTDLRVVTYRDSSRLFCGVRPTSGDAYFYDVALQRWHRRSSWGADAYQGGFYARAFGKHVWASPDSADIWTLEDDVYTDDDGTIERVMDLLVPLSGPQTISSIILDMRVFGQPLSGQGSDPVALITYFADGGRVDSITQFGDERTVSLGAQGNYTQVMKMTNFGRFDGRNGFLLRIRITDPIGFALFGVYVNEDPTN